MPTYVRLDEAAELCGLTRDQLDAILRASDADRRGRVTAGADRYVTVDELLRALGHALPRASDVSSLGGPGPAAVPRQLLTIDEAAEACALSRTKLHELLASGQIESCSIGRARRIPAEALEAFVTGLRRGAGSEPSPRASPGLRRLSK